MYPKASITQLSYDFYVLVKLAFHWSILDDQAFLCDWFIVMDNFHTCVINHILLIVQEVYLDYFEIEKFNWLKNRWSKSCKSVFILSSPLLFQLGENKLLKNCSLEKNDYFCSQWGRLHFGGRCSAKEYQIIKVP